MPCPTMHDGVQGGDASVLPTIHAVVVVVAQLRLRTEHARSCQCLGTDHSLANDERPDLMEASW